MAASESVRSRVLRGSKRLVNLRKIEVVVEAVVASVVLYRLSAAFAEFEPVVRHIADRSEDSDWPNLNEVVESISQAFGQMD